MLVNYILRLTGADDPRVLREMVIRQYGHFPLNTFAALSYAGAMLYYHPRALDNIVGQMWFGSHLIIVPAFFLAFFIYRKTDSEKRNYLNWYRVSLTMVFLSGTIWGLLPFSLYFIDHELTTTMIFSGLLMVVAAAVSLTSLPGGYLVFATLSVLLQSITVMVLAPHLFVYGLMGILFLIVAAQASITQNRQVTTTVRLRFEKDEALLKLEEAIRAKNLFFAAANHDLRQPMQAISLFTKALQHDGHADGKILDNLMESINGLENLYGELLDVSKLDAGAVEMDITDFYFRPVVDLVAAELSEEAGSKGLDLTVDCDNVVVRTDRILLFRVLTNIVSNAIRYTNDGKVSIECRLEDDEVMVSISDSGIGIDKEDQKKVFEEFVQLGSGGSGRSGLGLGLSIVRRLADLMDIGLALESTPGAGTTFTFTLQTGDPASVTGTPARPDESHIHGGNKPILFIDDERLVRESMREMLERWGYRCEVAGSLSDVRSIAADEGFTPALILSDLALGNGESGLEAIAAFRMTRETRIPAVLVTAETDPERISELNTANHPVLFKPVMPAKLRATIEQYLA